MQFSGNFYIVTRNRRFDFVGNPDDRSRVSLKDFLSLLS